MARFLTKSQIEILPTLNEVVYEPPAGLGSKPENKACRNCALWISGHDRCGIHAKDQIVFGFDNCSNHVPGRPSKRMLPIHMDPPLEPRYSGLGFYADGTACVKCNWFQADDGEGGDAPEGDCLRTRQDRLIEYARVQSMGCCARYRGARP